MNRTDFPLGYAYSSAFVWSKNCAYSLREENIFEKTNFAWAGVKTMGNFP